MRKAFQADDEHDSGGNPDRTRRTLLRRAAAESACRQIPSNADSARSFNKSPILRWVDEIESGWSGIRPLLFSMMVAEVANRTPQCGRGLLRVRRAVHKLQLQLRAPEENVDTAGIAKFAWLKRLEHFSGRDCGTNGTARQIQFGLK